MAELVDTRGACAKVWTDCEPDDLVACLYPEARGRQDTADDTVGFDTGL